MTEAAGDQVRLTKEQRRPVLARAVSVALAAGAGCGKTTVLTERFLGEIDGVEGRPLRTLAAMTFTDKAAPSYASESGRGAGRSLRPARTRRGGPRSSAPLKPRPSARSTNSAVGCSGATPGGWASIPNSQSSTP